MAEEKNTQFNYLLNAFERASQADRPVDHGYRSKREALIAHVRDLERKAALADEYMAWIDCYHRGDDDYTGFLRKRMPKEATSGVTEAQAPKLTVWFGSMPESNGRTNWTAILHRGNLHQGFTIARSEYPGRVRYAADEVRHLIGELEKRPHILDYDGDERTPCHLCGGSGEKDGKPCWGLNFTGPVHNAALGVTEVPAPNRLMELIDKLDGYLKSPEQITLRDELLAELRALGVSVVHPPGSAPEDSYPDQTILHSEREAGNCLQATVAGILGWPLAAVPHFALLGEDHWWDCLQAWLDSQGYWIDYQPTSYAMEGGELLPRCWLSGTSPRGFSHAVIGDSATLQMLHDPHPSRGGLVEHSYTIYFFRKPTIGMEGTTK